MGQEVEENLKEAATKGDVDFLKNCITSNKPNQYYLTVFTQNKTELPEPIPIGNIFHIATDENKEEFVRVAIELLPSEEVNKLLCQQNSHVHKCNPLHIAAKKGNVEIVKMFLKAFSSSSRFDDDINDDLPKPWLQKDEEGKTPCHWAIYNDKDDCALEILKMDKELLCNELDYAGRSLLYLAVDEGLNKVAMEILHSPHSFSHSGLDGLHPLHEVVNCSEEREDIFRLLIKKVPKLITQTAKNGTSVFHNWAAEGKKWPFVSLLNCDDIIPDVRRVFFELILTTNDKGENPFHCLTILKQSRTSTEEASHIGRLLIDIYRQQIEVLEEAKSQALSTREPWLMQDNCGKTPLEKAVEKRNEEFAKWILSEDNNALIKCQANVLFMAIEKRFYALPQIILKIIDEKNFTQLLTDDKKLNALHLAPKCRKEFCEELLKSRHIDLLDGVDKDGNTILHKWVTIGQVWAFETLLKNPDRISSHWRSKIVNQITNPDIRNQNNPLHVAASCTLESTYQVMKLIVEAFQEEHVPKGGCACA